MPRERPRRTPDAVVATCAGGATTAARVRRRVTVLAVAVAALVLAGCSSVPVSRPPVQPPVDPAALAGVTLVVGDQKGGSRSLLRAADLLDDLPYRIEWRTFTPGPPLIEAARAGAIDVGGTGNTPTIFAAAARARVQVVSSNRGNVTSDAILVRRDSPIRTVADLRGARIAVGKGTSAHGQVLSTLRAAGMTLDDVDLTFLAPADAYGAFRQGDVDAWAVWDPYTSQAELDDGARIVADGTGNANGYGFQVASNATLADPTRPAAPRWPTTWPGSRPPRSTPTPTASSEPGCGARRRPSRCRSPGGPSHAARTCRSRSTTPSSPPSRRWPTRSPRPG